jgi:hypothetical protein
MKIFAVATIGGPQIEMISTTVDIMARRPASKDNQPPAMRGRHCFLAFTPIVAKRDSRPVSPLFSAISLPVRRKKSPCYRR